MIITSRKIIQLTPQQELMIKSGWGEKTLHETITEEIVYRSLNGYSVKGYLAYPQGTEQGANLPLLIWNRGGIKSAGFIDTFLARGMFGVMASYGYAVLASMYGGSLKGEGEDEFGGKDVNDVLSLPLVAEETGIADINRIGIEGWSRGGMMTYLCLMQKMRVQCAVTIGAISDLRMYQSPSGNIKGMFAQKYGEEAVQAEIEKRSAILHADDFPDNIPLLMLHGKNDEIVSYGQSEVLAKSLQYRGRQCELVLINGGDHYLRKHRTIIDSHRFAFYEQYLKK